MRPRDLTTVAESVDGVLEWVPGGTAPDGSSPTVVTGVTIDSRRTGRGDLFVALPGDRVDGHDFVRSAFAAGAAAAMVAADREVDGQGPLVRVRDPGGGLLRLAGAERRGTTATVVGITGSTGKTCTKDFAGAVLGTGLRTVRSPASYNNEIGLPLTILSAPEGTEALVLEMGARGPGQIRLLCDVARPSIGVVTNVGVAHMERFGSAEAIRDAKAELPEALPEGGVAVLNGDDPVVRRFSERTRARAMFFGLGPGADVSAADVRVDARTGAASFVLRMATGSAPVTLRVPGGHMVPNALAAAAVGDALGLPVDAIAGGLAEATVSAGRMAALVTPDGVRVVDDAYNANPTSMAAALRSARTMAGAGRSIAVLGAMAELGPIAVAEHERVGELVVRLGFDHLITVGNSDDAALIAAAAEREGLEPDRIRRAPDADAAAAAVRSIARPGDLVLIKASRVEGLDRVAGLLAAGEPDDGRATNPGPSGAAPTSAGAAA